MVTDKFEHFQELDFDITISQNSKETLQYIEKIFSEYDVEIRKIEKVNSHDKLVKDKSSKYELVRIVSFYNVRNLSKNKLISSISSLKSVVEVATESDQKE